MKKQVWISAAVIAVVTVLVVVAAVSLLRPENPADTADPAGTAGPAEPAESAAPTSEDIPERPDCPGPRVGGVELPCLGGETVTAEAEITVVNVWAWWCEPCREELPALEEFARKHTEYTVVGVHADTNATNGAALLNDLGVDLPSYQDSDNSFAGTLGLPGVVPVTVVFRGEEKVGVVAKAFSSSSEIAKAVEEVL